MQKFFIASVFLFAISNHGSQGFNSLPLVSLQTQRNPLPARMLSNLYSTSYDGKPIEIDDVMDEAELALLAAQAALGEEEKAELPKKPKPPSEKPKMSEISAVASTQQQVSLGDVKDGIACGSGGLVLGSILGLVLLYEIPGLSETVSPTVPPLALGAVLGTVGLVGGLSEGEAGDLARKLLGAPTEAAVQAILNLLLSILESLGLAAKRRVEKTASDIKAIPGKVRDDIVAIPGKVRDAAATKAKETVDSAVNEITSIPSKVRDSAVQKAEETVTEIKSIPSKVGGAAKRRTYQIVDQTKISAQRTNEKIRENLPLIIIPSVVVIGIVFLATSPVGISQ